MTEETAVQEQATTEGAPEGNQRDFEAEARDWGWVPKDDFKGDPEKWKPAQQFVEDGETVLPIVRSQNKRLKEEIDTIKQSYESRFEKMERMNAKTLERQKAQYEQQISDIKTQQRAAVADGDQEAFDALEKKRETLEKEQSEHVASDDKPESVQAAWVAKNDWFTTDFDMADEATRYSQWLAQRNPSITLADNLAATEKHIKEKHPEKFGGKKNDAAATNGHAAVDGGGAFNAIPGAKKTAFDQLPAEAKAQAEKDVAQGLYKTKEEWAKVYNS